MYTSAILQYDENHVLYTNRAQALIQVGDYVAAATDCKMAVKLKPESVKVSYFKKLT